MPLYHRPDPLPALFVNRRAEVSLFQKPAASRRRASSAPPTQNAAVLYAGVLAGAAGALFVFLMLVLSLVCVGMVWESPHRGLFLVGLSSGFLIATFTTLRLLWRRLRSWRPLESLQTRWQRDTAHLGDFLKSGGAERVQRANDLC